MTEQEQVEKINNFLDCIAKYVTDDYNGVLMSLKVFNNNIFNNLDTFKEYQQTKWKTTYSTSTNTSYYEQILNHLELFKIEENDIFHSKFPLDINSPYSLPYDLTYFSEWFLKKSYDKNYVTGEITKARDAILEQMNEVFTICNLDFQFFKDTNKIHPNFYTIKDEEPGLIEGNIFMQRSFHLFICFENKTFMFEFTSGN